MATVKGSAIREQTLQTLKKYNSKQLQDKLDGGKLLGISKEVAEEILNDRKSKTPTEGKVPEEKTKVKEEIKKEKKDELVPASFNKTVKGGKELKSTDKTDLKKESVNKVEKPAKDSSEKKERKKRTVIELTKEQEAEITKLHKAGNSIFNIRKTLGLSWTIVNNFVNPAE